jgi:hypothetical protein
MSPRRKGEFVRVTAYVPVDVWDKTANYIAYNAVKDGGTPTISGYGAISNTVSSALSSYCNIVYDYDITKGGNDDDSCEEKSES